MNTSKSVDTNQVQTTNVHRGVVFVQLTNTDPPQEMGYGGVWSKGTFKPTLHASGKCFVHGTRSPWDPWGRTLPSTMQHLR